MNNELKNLYLVNFGKNVKKYREKQNLSQDELAIKCGYNSRSSINKIELGKSDVPYSKISLIANALKVREIDLINYDEILDTDVINKEIKLCEQIQTTYGKDAFDLLSTYLSLNNEGKQAAITMIQGLFNNNNFKD